MGYALEIAVRYLGSKKRSFVSLVTIFAILGVTVGTAALTIAMSVTGGFQAQFREKVLGVNAHVLVLKYSIDFREYREVMQKVQGVKGVIGVAPFVINPMMVTRGDRTATGVLLKGVDPAAMKEVLDLPKQVVEGSLEGLRRAGATPPQRATDSDLPPFGLGRDAGAAPAPKRSLFEAIQKQVAEDAADARREAMDLDAGVDDESGPPSTVASARPAKTGGPPPGSPPPGAPTGDVTPTGGFASELPSEDVLPDAVDPDPCRSPSETAKLPGVVVGRSLAKQLAVGIGDCVQITSPTIGISFGASARPPIAKQFRVIAMFEAGFDQYDSKLVYTDLYEAQAFYEYGDSVTGVEMKVADIDGARGVARQIDKLLSNSVYHTLDWQELNHGLFTALLIQKIGISVVLALMIVVAAFTVIAALIILVLDKKREIAVLKALGARNDAVLRVFLYVGGVIGSLGTTAGLGIGLVGCRALQACEFPLDPKVYFISKLPVTIRFEEFAIAGAFAVFTCLVATVFPAAYAANLRPSDGLRAE